jgi:hypothetical protein
MAYRGRADGGAAAHPDFVCPISHALMRDAVVAADGHSYERRHIERWFEATGEEEGAPGGRVRSPLTGAAMTGAALIPNHNLRKAIQSALEAAAVAGEEAAEEAAAEEAAEEAEEEAQEKKAVKGEAAEAASSPSGGSGGGSGGGGGGGGGRGGGGEASAASFAASMGAWDRLNCLLRLRRGGAGIGSGTRGAGGRAWAAESQEEAVLRELAARVEAEVGTYLYHGWRQGLPHLTST